MKRARTALAGLLLVVLAACGSSSVVQDKYYSLVLAAGDSAVASADQNAGARVVIGPIQLPAYLSQRGLPMQSGNRIESAHHHLWAEPPEEAISKVLTSDIGNELSGVAVERESGRWTAEANCRVRLEFDAFHPTSTSQVVTSGRYWIVAGESIAQRPFDLTRTLTRDGYGHAVDVLRGTLGALARQISGDIRQTPGCSAASP